MAFTYILYSLKINKYYVGACTDIDRRLMEHNSGKSTFTSTGMPWVLKFLKEFSTLQEA
jgi:putative endonuclease